MKNETRHGFTVGEVVTYDCADPVYGIVRGFNGRYVEVEVTDPGENEPLEQAHGLIGWPPEGLRRVKAAAGIRFVEREKRDGWYAEGYVLRVWLEGPADDGRENWYVTGRLVGADGWQILAAGFDSASGAFDWVKSRIKGGAVLIEDEQATRLEDVESFPIERS